ncbi:MAG: hypothetical protein AAFQ82_24915, partial [Myxococcota bacterium]
MVGSLVENVNFFQITLFPNGIVLTPEAGVGWQSDLLNTQLLEGFVQDLAGNQAEIEGEYLVALSAVYVDGTNGSAGAPGTPAAPLDTVGAGIAAAEPGQVVRIAESVYPESVALSDGVVLDGGWSSDFMNRAPLTQLTVLAPDDSSSAPSNSPTGTISCTNVSSAVVTGLEIRGAGGSSRAGVVVGSGCGERVIFAENRIVANTTAGTAYGVYVEDQGNALFALNEILGGSDDGSSYGVYLESTGAALVLTDNLIDGWHGNPMSYGVYHVAGSATLSENEIFGGSGASGGRLLGGHSCPVDNGTSIGVELNGVVATVDNVIFGGATTALDSACTVSGASTSKGVVLNATQTSFSGNVMSAGRGPQLGCGASYSVGIETVTNDFVNLVSDGGGACGGSSDLSRGLHILPGASVTVQNAILTGGTTVRPTGVYAGSGAS